MYVANKLGIENVGWRRLGALVGQRGSWQRGEGEVKGMKGRGEKEFGWDRFGED